MIASFLLAAVLAWQVQPNCPDLVKAPRGKVKATARVSPELAAARKRVLQISTIQGSSIAFATVFKEAAASGGRAPYRAISSHPTETSEGHTASSMVDLLSYLGGQELARPLYLDARGFRPNELAAFRTTVKIAARRAKLQRVVVIDGENANRQLGQDALLRAGAKPTTVDPRIARAATGPRKGWFRLMGEFVVGGIRVRLNAWARNRGALKQFWQRLTSLLGAAPMSLATALEQARRDTKNDLRLTEAQLLTEYQDQFDFIQTVEMAPVGGGLAAE